MLNPVHLRTLQAVVNTGSFADAGRSLGYTGSAVSQQIAALERQLRTDLFERDAHGVRPTPTALFIAEQSTSALTSLGMLEEDVAAHLDGAVGTLRLGSFPSASERLLPATIAALSRRNPQVRVHLDDGEPAELVPMLQRRELDLALGYACDLVPSTWPSDVTATPLLFEDLVLLMPEHHRLAGAAYEEAGDLADVNGPAASRVRWRNPSTCGRTRPPSGSPGTSRASRCPAASRACPSAWWKP